MNRDAIHAALQAVLAVLTTSAGVKLIARPKTPQDLLSPSHLPALLIVGDREHVARARGLPPKVTLKLDLFVHVPTQGQAPGIVLDSMLASVEAALAPAPGMEVQTLGGLVSHAWIEGEIERFETGMPDKAMAIIPIHILVP